jgi:hypothetical protein
VRLQTNHTETLLELRDSEGEIRVLDFCDRNKLVIINIFFKKPRRKLYIWKIPGDRSRQQWDYIIVKHLYRKSVKDVQAMRGADNDSDHNLLVGNICTKLKNI